MTQPPLPDRAPVASGASSAPEGTALVAQVARTLHSSALVAAQNAPVTWRRAVLEWSQAADQHSGRSYLETDTGIVRLPLEDSSLAALATHRRASARPGTGTWFAALVAVTPDGTVTSTFEWNARPYWNALGIRMVPTPGEALPSEPVPSLALWHQDLGRFPRSAEHLPGWLTEVAESAPPSAQHAAQPSPASHSGPVGPSAPLDPSPPLAITAPAGTTTEDTATFSALRTRLDSVGYPAEAVVLPDLGTTPGTVEGAMEVRGQAGGYVVGIRDYGTFTPLRETGTAQDAAAWLWEYLCRATPTPTATPRSDLEERANAYRPVYAAMYERVRVSGSERVTLDAGVALDRIGSLDGVYLYPWSTPLPARSLPPTAGPNVRLHQVVTGGPLLVDAEIVPAWFGQPGGSLRFRTVGTHVRELVENGTLIEVTVAP